MLDYLFSLASQIAWVLFAIYTIAYFARTFGQEGWELALIRLFSYRVMLPLFAVISISLLSAAMIFVEPTEVGVVISALSPGGIRSQPLRPGLHWIVPILERGAIYNISWQTYTMSALPREGDKLGDDSIRARTKDGQEVRLDCSVIFRIDAEQSVALHIDWQSRYVDEFVRPLVRSLVRTQVSQYSVSEVNSSSRKDLEALLDRLMHDEFADKGLILDKFLLRDTTFSPEYATAIERKQIALEGQEQAKYEAEQVRTSARGKADAIKTEAEAKAEALKLVAAALQQNPDLLTYEYINKLSPNIRVMLVPNNSPYLLPLPNLETTEAISAALPLTVTTVAPVSSSPINR